MQFTKGKKYNNEVVGNKPNDNKQAGNKNKTTHSATQKGSIGPSAGDTKLRVQNSSQFDGPANGSQDGNATIRKADKYSKKPTAGRQTLYSDGAMSVAKRARGL